MEDLTGRYNYEKLIDEEKQHYSKIEITEQLTEGGSHDYDSWHYYWLRVNERIDAGFGDFEFGHDATPIEITVRTNCARTKNIMSPAAV